MGTVKSIADVGATLFACDVRFEQGRIYVLLCDGSELNAPLVWFPKLYRASIHQLSQWQITARGLTITWKSLNAEISLSALA